MLGHLGMLPRPRPRVVQDLLPAPVCPAGGCGTAGALSFGDTEQKVSQLQERRVSVAPVEGPKKPETEDELEVQLAGILVVVVEVECCPPPMESMGGDVWILLEPFNRLAYQIEPRASLPTNRYVDEEHEGALKEPVHPTTGKVGFAVLESRPMDTSDAVALPLQSGLLIGQLLSELADHSSLQHQESDALRASIRHLLLVSEDVPGSGHFGLPDASRPGQDFGGKSLSLGGAEQAPLQEAHVAPVPDDDVIEHADAHEVRDGA